MLQQPNQQPTLKELKIGSLAKTGDECFFVIDPPNGCILNLELAFVSYLDPDTLISHWGEGRTHNPDSDHILHLSDRVKWTPF